MTATLSNVVIKDGNNADIVGNVLALDTSGTGVGPWLPAHILVDGVAGTNRAAVDSSNRLAVLVGAGATNIAKAEDVPSADADVGVPAMAIRKAAPANTSGTDGDYEMLQIANGRLWGRCIITDVNDVPILSAVNALNSTGAGLQAAQLVGQFDDVAPTAITENQFGNLRMSTNRNLYGTIRDAAGNERGANVTASGALVVKDDRSATGTQSNVAASASDVTVLASNANRLGATVFNDSTAILYLLLANATSSATVHTHQVGAGGYYEVPFGYTGVIKGIWASATGSARVTELT